MNRDQTVPSTTDNTEKSSHPYIKPLLVSVVVVMLAIIFIIYIKSQPPKSFDNGAVFEVRSGMSVQAITKAAAEQGLVKSPLLLYAVLTYFHDPTNIYAGRHIFTTPQSVFGVANQLAANLIEEELVKLTFPEGITTAQMSIIASDQLPNFISDQFVASTTGKEGYLFPDTYFVPDTFTATDLAQLQLKTFEEKIAELRPLVDDNSLSLESVITLASIIEREANNESSMKMVSGILQNRLAINMALQADATIEYVLDTPLNELPAGQLAKELRELDSPYNTYLYTGLPPTPIGNPGLQAIEAVLIPTPSEYLYYITGDDGEFYYAKTLSEHNQNIVKYLQ